MEKFREYVNLIDNALARQDFDSEPKELYQPIDYIMALGGKRLRPALTIAACDLFNGEVQDALLPALGIEVFHNFSLVHDDIMDNASLRRGKKTVHEKWNTNIAILAGDAMLVKAYQYIAKVDREILPKVLKTFSQMAIQVCEGQQYDMNFEVTAHVEEEDYLDMIRHKTSVLLGAALEIGAHIAKAPSPYSKVLYDFGVNIGLAFQMQDDLLDSFGDSDKFGKKIGGDILNDKKTLLYIQANKSSPPPAASDSPDQKIEAFQNWFKDSGAKTYVEQKRDEFYKKAISLLDSIPGKPEVKGELAGFAKSLVNRDH